MQLNLPSYPFRVKTVNSRRLIFDEFRKRWVALTPEEWVRQHFVRYLTVEKNFPATLIAVECALKINQQDFRADAVVFSREGKNLMIIECKAPEVKITQQVFDQIARYNLKFRVQWLVVTNGISHYCCKLDYDTGGFSFVEQIPDFGELTNS